MSTDNNAGAPAPAPTPEPAQPAPSPAPVQETAQPQQAPVQEAAPAPAAPAQDQAPQPVQAQNENTGAGKGPSHIAYHVRDVGEDKSYFNRVGSAFEHKDGKGFNVILDALPVDGKLTLRTPKERLSDLKEGKSGQGERGRGR